MINFNDCDVIIKGTGLFAESASISQSNSLSRVDFMGYKNSELIPNGGVSTDIQISYRPVASSETVFSTISELKNFASGLSPIPVEIAGLECSGYITNFTLSANPNQVANASVSLICYHPIEGSISEKRGTVYYENDPMKFIHGWSTIINYNNTGFASTYAFDYSISFNYSPMYCLGEREPKSVILLGGQERISVVKDRNVNVDFIGTGQVAYIFNSSDNTAKLKEISAYNGNINPFITINFDQCAITESAINANVDDYLKVRIVAERNF